MRRSFVLLLAMILASGMLAGLPTASAQDTPLQVVGEHTLQVFKTGKDQDASVTESVFYTNTGDQPYDGELWFDLDPDAELIGYYFVRGDRSPLGDAGQVDRSPLPNETAGAHTRYIVSLADKNVTFEPGSEYGVNLIYRLPQEDRNFTRGFTMETPLLTVTVGQVPGLAPRSDDVEFVPLANTWTYSVEAADRGPFAEGDAFTFTFEEVPVPKTPLTVEVTSSGTDPLTLRATASGGIPDYTYEWDLDGDGECDDATGQETELTPTEAGTHRVTACVTDMAAPPGSAEQQYAVRTTDVVTVTETTGPGAMALGLLGLLLGAILVFGLVSGGIIQVGGARGRPAAAKATSGRSLGVESKDMLQMRQRTMIAALKELEIAKKKGEVGEDLYTPLKAELKQDTVRVMRELEKRKEETV